MNLYGTGSFGNNTTLVFGGGSDVANDGTITMANAAKMRAAGGEVRLHGSGEVNLNGNSFTGADADARLVNASSIYGPGTLGGFDSGLVNEGLIQVGTSGATLTVNSTAAGLTNTGTLRASGGGTLTVQGGTLDNSTGSIEALDGSHINLATTVTHGGAWHSAGSGNISLAGGTLLSGMITNDAVVNGGGGAISGDVTIDGGTFTGALHGASTADRLTNGGGTFTAVALSNMTYVNQGVLIDGSISGNLVNAERTISVPSSKTLSVQGTIDNTDGVIESAGHVQLSGFNGLAGTLRTLPGGTMTLSGTVPDASALVFDNQGTDTFTDVKLGATDLRLSSGQYTLYSLTGLDPESRLTNVAGTISGGTLGNGTLAIDNQGTIENAWIQPNADGMSNTGTVRSVGNYGYVWLNAGNYTNTGLITADMGSVAINSGASVVNAGGEIAANGGTVTINAGALIDNSGGLISVNSGSVILDRASLTGGTVYTAPGAIFTINAGIESSQIADVTIQNEGHVQFGLRGSRQG